MSAAPVFVPTDASRPVPGAIPLRACAPQVPGVLPASRLGERPVPETVPTGIAALDALTGGFPRGALSEICGPASSGRTSVLLALLAGMTRRQEVCALVDTSDSFDPHSAAAAGVDLARLLWVRCTRRIADCRLSNDDLNSIAPGRKSSLIRNRQSAIVNRKSSIGNVEQALKATDLLLQGGGFGLVVVDLADIPPHTARRIPLTSWFRFRRVVESTPTVLLVLEEEPYAKSCASLVIRLAAQPSESRQSSVVSRQENKTDLPTHARLLHGLRIEAQVLRTVHRKPPHFASAAFESRTAWKDRVIA